MKSFTIKTKSRTDFINIDKYINNFIKDIGFINGILVIFVPHTTAGITINENADPDVTSDMELILNRIVPWEAGYDHLEGNSAAHVKASMMGNSTHIIINNGILQLGTWQSIYFCEFDGPRNRKVWIEEIIK